MTTNRRGAAKGTGSGYRNLRGFPRDSSIHKQSARGMKQPQRLNIFMSRSTRGKYAEQNEKVFPLKDGYEIRAHWEKTRNGFRHVARLYKNYVRYDEATANYQNRTWESYEYQTVLSKLLDKTGALTPEEKAQFLKKGELQAEKEADAMLGSVAMVAKMGEVLTTTQKEKNDWKARMLKAGLGNKGLEMPEDWDTLSEDEKEKRLDKVIAFMQSPRGGKSPPQGTPKERIIKLHNEGYSSAAIALRTGMPIRYIESITEKIVGGLGDGKPDSAFDMNELKKGINVEMEHTNDPAKAKEISKDHLTEDKDYYKKLAKMEAGDTTTPTRVQSRPERIPNPSYTNNSIGGAFFRGERGGKSLHMKIVDTPTETLLVGYNWAVYGARDKSTGRTTYYKGWDGYSRTTSKQLGQTGLRSANRIDPSRRTLTGGRDSTYN